MDLAQLNIIRTVGLPLKDRVMKLPEKLAIAVNPEAGTHLHSSFTGGSIGTEDIPSSIGDSQDSPLTKDAAGGSSILQKTYVLLNTLSDSLTEHHDRLPGDEINKEVAARVKQLKLDSDLAASPLAGTDLNILFQIALLGIRKALVNAMNPATGFQGAELLTRLALIAGLLTRSSEDVKAMKAEEVFDALNRQPVVLIGVPPAKLTPKAQVKLIRDAKVADLYVVRSEWKAFIPSEVANIRNIMVGESFEQKDKTTSETETTTTQTTQTSTQTQQESSTKLDSELSQQVSTQLGITVNGHFDASASFSYPQVTASVSAGVDASLSIQKSEAQASKIAQEAITRAVSQVDSMTRESRTRRELMRTQQGFKYSVSNTTGGNVHAVYRWVDRIDNYQVFRFPYRFLLEFQIPEPAEYYRWRTSRSSAAAAQVDQPPTWDLTASQITPNNLIKLAAKYRASDVPAAPDDSISVSATLSVDAGKESLPPDDGKTVWNISAASKDLSVTIPPNYIATKLYFSGEGYPIRGKWRNSNGKDYEGYHSTFATVCVGNQSVLFWNGGISSSDGTSNGNKIFQATHGSNTDIGVVSTIEWSTPWEPPYGRALLPIGSDASLQPKPVELDLADATMPGVPNTLNISVTTMGLNSCAMSFMVKCQLTEQAFAAWQLSVYDALYAAWAQWKKDYQTNQMRQQMLGTGASDAGSSQRNEQIIQEELKREVIAWLLDETGFSGRPDLLPASTTETSAAFSDISFDNARTDAPVVQFMEQAFEWNNMTYVFYPYYWSDRHQKWDTLSQITANDAQFERFLRAGSSRVIVPATPGFENAVQNWLMYKVPFLNGRLPAPDDPMYVSIDKEIREITSPWDGGIAGDSWQTRISTTMLYLEKDGTLPFDNDEAQLPAEQGVPFVQKTY